jgi:hypothetical protein
MKNRKTNFVILSKAKNLDSSVAALPQNDKVAGVIPLPLEEGGLGWGWHCRGGSRTAPTPH